VHPHLGQVCPQGPVRRKAVELPSGEKRWVKIDLQNELGASEADVAEFAEALTIRLAEQYEKHKERVYHKLGEVLGISHTEVTEYTYPTALTTVSRLATQRSVSHRKITKESFLALLTPSSALYSIWTLREKGETAYVRHIKRTHFSCLNVDQAERFFVIEGFQDSTKEDLRRLIYRVILHWSSYKSRRKPNQERYAPYFLFVGVIGDKLADIKSLLFLDGVAFVDGYPFQGASFSVAQLIRQQTLENRIAARFVNDFEELQVALDGLARPKFIFHFYSRMATNFSCNCELIRIPVPSLTMIEAIV
jgi:hypothetical protein